MIPEARHGKPVIGILACHSGDAAQAEKDLEPLRDLGKPIADLMGVGAPSSSLEWMEPKPRRILRIAAARLQEAGLGKRPSSERGKGDRLGRHEAHAEAWSARDGAPARAGTPAMRVAAIIPAMNEAATVGDVVDAAVRSSRIEEVIVVDNDSTDNTASVAAARGARVVRCAQGGKGEAMRAGVAATDAACIVFLDADLLGLRPDHVDALAQPVVEGRSAMACGLFDRGRRLNPLFLRVLPVLTGERAVCREIFESLADEEVSGYKVEAALNSRCSDLGVPTVRFVCDGLWHLVKEKKYANPIVGMAAKVGMLLTAAAEYAAYPVRRRLRRRRRRGATR
jgi:hypothetical protein